MSALTLQLLSWVASRPRTYAEAMDAWRSTCPRLSIWDDGILDRLLEVDTDGGGMEQSLVRLTAEGRAVLDRH